MSGIIGVIREEKDVMQLITYGLYALQHRGQVEAGIGVLNDGKARTVKKPGLVSDVLGLNKKNMMKGNRGLGHVKYAFSDHNEKNKHIFPESYEFEDTSGILAVDGNIHNKDICFEEMVNVFRKSDEEIKAYAASLRGAFSIIYLDDNRFIGVRDPLGLKPLYIGKIASGYVLCSETCGLDVIGADYIRDLEPGEIVIIDGDGFRSFDYATREKKVCLFEFIYTSRPDSYVDGISVYKSRIQMGKNLFEESPAEGDIVIGAPDSGLIAAKGYAKASGIKSEDGIIKNRYIGRTFIEPDEEQRKKGVIIKLNPIREVIDGQRVILVDDSIVRGTTIRRTVDMLKSAGAREVHIRIAAPPIVRSCDLSVDTPDENKLIAHNYTPEEIRERIGADSLAYLSVDGLKDACSQLGFCDHCFTGNYPLEEEI